MPRKIGKAVAATEAQLKNLKKARAARKRNLKAKRHSRSGSFAERFARIPKPARKKMGKAIRKGRIAHADSIDKKCGLKPTSFLVKMYGKMDKHKRELETEIERRLASDSRPKCGPSRKPKSKKKSTKSGSKSSYKKRAKGRSPAQRANDIRLGKAAKARARKPGRPKGSKSKKRGPGRPKGSKNKKNSGFSTYSREMAKLRKKYVTKKGMMRKNALKGTYDWLPG